MSSPIITPHKTVLLHIRVTPRFYERLVELADQTDQTVPELARWAMKRGLAEGRNPAGLALFADEDR